MAKTLKERAEDYSMYDNGMDKSMFGAYMDGAEDQRKIDIDKACYFIKRNTTLDRWVNVDAIAEQLRKAMEDEQ